MLIDGKMKNMSRVQSLFEQISAAVSRVLPTDLSQDVRRNIESTVRGVCEGLELVTRDELQVQEAVMQRTREKVEKLEAQVHELEELLRKKEIDA